MGCRTYDPFFRVFDCMQYMHRENTSWWSGLCMTFQAETLCGNTRRSNRRQVEGNIRIQPEPVICTVEFKLTEVLLWPLSRKSWSLCLGMSIINGIRDPKYCYYDVAILSKAKVITNNNNHYCWVIFQRKWKFFFKYQIQGKNIPMVD